MSEYDKARRRKIFLGMTFAALILIMLLFLAFCGNKEQNAGSKSSASPEVSQTETASAATSSQVETKLEPEESSKEKTTQNYFSSDPARCLHLYQVTEEGDSWREKGGYRLGYHWQKTKCPYCGAENVYTYEYQPELIETKSIPGVEESIEGQKNTASLEGAE